MDIHAKLKQLVTTAHTKGRSLREIAESAKIPLDILQNWYSGRTKTLDVANAEKINLLLAGRGFM